MNALRSKANANANRISGLSKGGASRLVIRLALAFAGASSQTACGAWLLTSRNSGTVTSTRIRRVTLVHAIFSFLFVSAIIGFVVNVISNVT